MRSNKKGQIALFIIVGLLILLGTAFFISYAALKRQEIAPSITQTATASTPAWAAPVNEFVESCMKEIAIRGFKKLGEHGGYIDLADAGIVNKVFDLNPAPTESDVVYPSSSQAAPIPYWFYMKSPNTCTGCQVSTNKPSQSDMQAQISNYMNDELPPCLNNLQKFRDQGYSIDFGELSTTTSIDDIGVTVSVDYPITVSRAGQSAALPSFTINLDLNLNDIFQLASFILLQQVNEMFLEDTTLSLIGLKAGLPDLARVPPLYHADSKPFYVTWSMPMVEQKVKNDILASYIPLIQIANTRGAKKLVGSGPLEQGLYDSLFLEPFIGEFPDLKVNFEFNPMKQVYFSITPNENGLLKPSVSSTSPPVNIIPDQANNVYEFFYDMSFPVIVTIRDNRSLTQNGETGYTFRFAIEANIRDNKNLLDWFRGRGTIGQLDLSNVQTVTSFPQNVPGACNKRPDDKYVCELDGSPNDGRVFNQEMLCQQDCHMNIFPPADYTEVPSLECASSQKISGEHTIKLKDKKLNTPIEGARVSYSCGNSRRCFLGMTDGNGLFDGRSQICIGDGLLSVEKDQYLTINLPGTEIRPGDSLNLNLETRTFPEKQIEVVFINVSNMFRLKRLLTPYLSLASFSLEEQDKIRRHDSWYYSYQIRPKLMRNLGPLHGLTLSVLREIENNRCRCNYLPGGYVDCSPCTPDNIDDNKLSEADIQNILSYFKLPENDTFVEGSGPGNPFIPGSGSEIEIPYIRPFHQANLKLLPLFNYNDIDRETVADALEMVFLPLEKTYQYLQVLKADPNFIDTLLVKKPDGSQRHFTGNLLPLPSATPGADVVSAIEDAYKILKKEFDNIQIRKDAELTPPAIKSSYRGLAHKIRQNDEVVIQLQKVKDFPHEGSLPLSSALVNYSLQTPLTIIPGKYEITINANRKEPVTISRNDLLNTVTLPGGGSYIAGQDIDYTYVGGLHITEATGYWRVTESQLDASSKIRFYVIQADIPENAEDFSEIGQIDWYSDRYRAFVEPEFIP